MTVIAGNLILENAEHSGSATPDQDNGKPSDSAAAALNENDLQGKTGAGQVNTSKGKEKQTYASLFKDNRAPIEASLLHFVAPPVGKMIIDAAEIDSVEKTFGYCLVGYVMGTRPSPFAVMNFLKGWGGNVKFLFRENGWIQFQFATESDRDHVLNGGYYRILGRQLFLKKMPSCFLFGKDEMEFIPTWVQILGLPKQCWTPAVLSRIASITGKPIHSDVLTISKKGASYARVLVEIDAKKERLFEYEIELPTGKSTMVFFKYESDFKYCSKCKTLGHVTEMCGAYAKRRQQQGKRKQTTDEPTHEIHNDQQEQIPGSSEGPRDQEAKTVPADSRILTEVPPLEVIVQPTPEANLMEGDTGKTSADSDLGKTNPLETNTEFLEHPKGGSIAEDDIFDANGSNEFFNEDYDPDSEGSVELLSFVEVQDKLEWNTVKRKKNRFLKKKFLKKGDSSLQAEGGTSSRDTELVLVDHGSKQPLQNDGSRYFGNKHREGRPPKSASGSL